MCLPSYIMGDEYHIKLMNHVLKGCKGVEEIENKINELILEKFKVM